jgi:hypothetical protein
MRIFEKDDIFWLVLELEISYYKVLNILNNFGFFFRGFFFEDYIFGMVKYFSFYNYSSSFALR